MPEEESKINCSTFQKHEPAIKKLTDKINTAEDPKEKIKYAEELLKEVNIILPCTGYKEEDIYCWNCHTIANLRKATAELIIKTKKLT